MLIQVYSSQSTTSSQVGSRPTDEYYVDYYPYRSRGFGPRLLRRRGEDGGFVGVGSSGAFEENLPDKFVFVGLTGLGVLATAEYYFVTFPDVGGCAVSVGGVGAVCAGVGRGVGCGSVSAVSSVGLGGAGPCVWDGAPGCTVVVVGVIAGGMGSASRCG